MSKANCEKLGGSIIMSGRLFILGEQQDDLIVEVRNAEINFRFWTVSLEPWTDLIDVEQIDIRRKGDRSDSRLLQGDPANILQIMNEGRLSNGPFLLQVLDQAQRDTEIVFTLRNNEAVQGVQVTVSLIGDLTGPMLHPIERRPLTMQDPAIEAQNRALIERRGVMPQQGPISGIDGAPQYPGQYGYGQPQRRGNGR